MLRGCSVVGVIIRLEHVSTQRSRGIGGNVPGSDNVQWGENHSSYRRRGNSNAEGVERVRGVGNVS